MLFWPAFLLIQWLLFWPAYLLGDDTATFVPQVLDPQWQWSTVFTNAFIWRTNPDIFRFNAEVTLLVTLWITCSFLRRVWIRYALIILYGLIFLYYAYESLFLAIYQATPILYNNIYMVKDGLQFLLSNLHLSTMTYLVAFAAVILVCMAMVTLLYIALPVAPVGRVTRIAMSIFALLIAISTYHTKSASADPRMIASAVTFKVTRNINDSMALRRKVLDFDVSTIWNTYDLSSYRLANSPNIYLIFVESYGSVLYMREHFTPPYLDLLDRVETDLTGSGWFAASALSESPTWGGGSWMAYTSAMFGIPIDNQPQFLALFDRFQYESFHYPDLASYLRAQGYEYIWVSSLSTELSQHRWRQYQNFYHMDRWIKHSDLEFVGPQYGWGPAPPDQYALSFASQEVKSSNKPFLLFFITQNSHYPYAPLPDVVQDWRTLNLPGPEPDNEPPEVFSADVARRDYMTAVEYELTFLSQFIRENGTDNDLFVLVGDHQPPRVSRRADTFTTPIHIISRNEALVRSLESKSFTRGLVQADLEADLGHAGIYSLITSLLYEHYGRPGILDSEQTPSTNAMHYLPYGLSLDLPEKED